MKILHLIHKKPPENSGAARQAIKLARELDKLGCIVKVVSFTMNFKLSNHQDRLYIGSVFSKISSIFYIFRKFYRYDIIHIHGFSYIYLPIIIFFRSKIVVKITMEDQDDLVSIRKKLKPFLFNYLEKKVYFFVALTKQILLNNQHLSNKIKVIPNGVDILNEEIKIIKNNRITYLGGSSDRKGHKELKKLFLDGYFNGYELILLGYYNKFEESFWKNQSNVQFVGIVENPIDYMISAQYTFYYYIKEGLPNVLLEAISLKRKLIINKKALIFKRELEYSEYIIISNNSLLKEKVIEPLQLPSAFKEIYGINNIASIYINLYNDFYTI